MFKNLFKVNNVSNELKTSLIEVNKLEKKISDSKEKAKEIQAKFNFQIPDYIIDEIVENETSKSYINLHYLINCALVNERISESNAKILKQVYKLNSRCIL